MLYRIIYIYTYMLSSILVVCLLPTVQLTKAANQTTPPQWAYDLETTKNTLDLTLALHYKTNSFSPELLSNGIKLMWSKSDPSRIILSVESINDFFDNNSLISNTFTADDIIKTFASASSYLSKMFEKSWNTLYNICTCNVAETNKLYKDFLIEEGSKIRNQYNFDMYKYTYTNVIPEYSWYAMSHFEANEVTKLDRHQKAFFKFLAIYSRQWINTNNMSLADIKKGLTAFKQGYSRAMLMSACPSLYQDDLSSATYLYTPGLQYVLPMKHIAETLDAHTTIFLIDDNKLSPKTINHSGITSVGEDVNGYFIKDLSHYGAAAMSGIAQMDYIREIDDIPIDLSVPRAKTEQLSKGSPGKNMSITISRYIDSTETQHSFIVRCPKTQHFSLYTQHQQDPDINHTIQESHISYRSLYGSLVPQSTNNKVGILRFDTFSEATSNTPSSATMLKQALHTLISQGMNVLVLDLRFNGGGVITQITEIGSLFMKSGIMFFTCFKDNGQETILAHNIPHDSPIIGDIPIIILISSQTASAAECLAQTMQECGRAIVIGSEQSFGKGSTQIVMSAPDPSLYTFQHQGKYCCPCAITIGFFYSPKGKSNQIDGVKSDIVLSTNYYTTSWNFGERYEEFVVKAPILNLDSIYKHSNNTYHTLPQYNIRDVLPMVDQMYTELKKSRKTPTNYTQKALDALIVPVDIRDPWIQHSIMIADILATKYHELQLTQINNQPTTSLTSYISPYSIMNKTFEYIEHAWTTMVTNITLFIHTITHMVYS